MHGVNSDVMTMSYLNEHVLLIGYHIHVVLEIVTTQVDCLNENILIARYLCVCVCVCVCVESSCIIEQ